MCNQTLGDCTSCPSATCVKTANSGSTPTTTVSGGGGPNIGAIVGGVIGGVAFITIAVFLVWKYWLKGRRHEVEVDEYEEDPNYPLEKPDLSVFARGGPSRASTHTVASMASTVLTRASNIIQIAYIPGVTNRTASASPNLLVPPVPPIPIPTTPSTTSSQFDDQRFFVPGDLRDSTYSDTSSVDARRPGSIASSLARNSVATTVYRDSAVLNPMPAQAVFSSKAAVVSVKSGLSANNSPAMPSGSSSLVQSLGSQRYDGNAPRPVMFQMPASSDSAKSGSSTGAMQTMKPVALTIVKKGNKASSSNDASRTESSPETTPDRKQTEHVGLGLRPLTNVSLASGDTAESPGARARRSVTLTLHTGDSDDSEDELEAHERSRRSLLSTRESKVQSPFTDDAEAPKTPTTPTAPVMHKPKTDTKSPFEDQHAV